MIVVFSSQVREIYILHVNQASIMLMSLHLKVSKSFANIVGGYSLIDRGSDRPIIEKGPIDRGSFRPRV